MRAKIFKEMQWIGLAAVVLLVLFAFARQSGLFGLGRSSETVIVPSGSRLASGGTAYLDAGGATDSEVASVGGQAPRQLEIVTLLPFDAIPAIFDPTFISADQASNDGASNLRYRPDEKVLGIEINGDARAYSVPVLSRHEVVNDVVGGVPVAVTW